MAADCRLRAMPELRFQPAAGLRGHRPGEPGAVLLDLEGVAVSVAIARDGSVRLRAAPSALAPDSSEAVGLLPWRPSPAEPFAEDDGRILLAFDGPEGAATVVIEPEPFAVQVRDRDGQSLARLSGLAFEPGGAGRIALDAHPNEHFFGFGEKTGRLDKRGSELRMRCRDANIQLDSDPLYVSIPFFLGFRAQGSGAPSQGGLASRDRTLAL